MSAALTAQSWLNHRPVSAGEDAPSWTQSPPTATLEVADVERAQGRIARHLGETPTQYTRRW